MSVRERQSAIQRWAHRAAMAGFSVVPSARSRPIGHRPRGSDLSTLPTSGSEFDAEIVADIKDYVRRALDRHGLSGSPLE